MSALPYLVAHRPRITQFRPRRRKPTGLFVIHTAESAPDEKGPDTGTLNVAEFIRTRVTYGSYHGLADSDSRLRVIGFDQAAYGDGTGSNDFAIHVSFATQAAQWASLPKAWRDGAIEQAAAEIADGIEWLLDTHGIHVPLKRVTRDQSDAGAAGFISHAERDPDRRTDPGKDFPWDQLLDEVAAELARRTASEKPRPGRLEVYARRRDLTKLAQALKPGRLRDSVKAARNRLPKPKRSKRSRR